jgi:hypothetical protein
MKAGNIQRFELNDFLLQYDFTAGVLLCKSISLSKNLWIKKIEEGGIILDVIESDAIFFIAFEYNDTDGIFLAINRSDGKTAWFIPGRAYMYRVFGEFIFLIFIDEEGRYFLIKSSCAEGGIIWHHEVDIGLAEYTIRSDYLLLVYRDGRKEVLDMETGEEID